MDKLNIIFSYLDPNHEIHEQPILRGTHNPRFQDRDYQKFENELSEYDENDHKDAIIWVDKLEGIF